MSSGQGLVSRESSYVVQPEVSWRGTATRRATVVMNKHDNEPDWFTALEGDSVSLIASLAPVTSLGIRGRTQWNVFNFRDRGSFIAQQNERLDGIQLREIARTVDERQCHESLR